MTPSRTPSPASGMSLDDAAAYWLARHDADPASAADPAFLDWLATSERHAETWRRAQALWRQAAEDLKHDPLTDALRASALAARPPAWPKALAAASIAAAVLVAAVGGWRHWSGREPSSPQSFPAAPPPIEIATQVGERRQATLTDGTRLDLDGATRVEVAFDQHSRRLRLQDGQAYVEVGHDPARPFAVDVGDQTIVDRGTAFGVRLESGAVSVVLVQGGVAVGRRGGPADHQLAPGQQLVLQPGRTAIVEAVDVKSALAWRDGFVEFSDTPLSEAVAEMNRHGGRRMVVSDPRLGSLKVSGRFKLGDSDRFLRTISLLLPVRAVRVGEVIEIRGAR